MKIIFFGSDDFAAAHVASLAASSYGLAAVVTQPDRPKGRGMKVEASLVKACAQRCHIPVLQPGSLKDDEFVKTLKDFHADMFVVVAYGQFLPAAVLDIPPLGAINVHPSLLPKYRGAAPVNWVIINGETETGVSIMKINHVMDAGDILAQEKVDIHADDTAVTLKEKIVRLSPEVLLKTIRAVEDKTCVPVAQDDARATFAPKLTKAVGHICWQTEAVRIRHLARGLLPWPGAYTFYRGKILKILEARVEERDFPDAEAGTVVRVDKTGILVAAGKGGVLVKQLHPRDSKPMDAYSFVVGHRLEVGFRFDA
jgi:methionyl-tRNA formyltransferase